MNAVMVDETLWNGNKDANYRGRWVLDEHVVVIEIQRGYYPLDSTAKIFLDGKGFLGRIESDRMQTNRTLRSGYAAATQQAFEADVNTLLELAREKLSNANRPGA